MRRHRIFVDQSLREGLDIEFGGDNARYIQQVLRLKEGQAVVVFDGRGGEYDAEITRVQKRQVAINVHTRLEPHVESRLDIHVGQGVARGDRMDYAIQKAVELGARTVTPVGSERSVIRLAGERERRRIEHWQNVAVHASEQSGRTGLMAINPPMTIEQWVREVDVDLKLCLDPRASQDFNGLVLEGNRLALLVGPEGGLTEHELDLAAAAGFVRTRLGPRTLRTETATVVGLTAIQLRWGDLHG